MASVLGGTRTKWVSSWPLGQASIGENSLSLQGGISKNAVSIVRAPSRSCLIRTPLRFRSIPIDERQSVPHREWSGRLRT